MPAMGTIAGFVGPVLGPGDIGYDEARRLWNGAIDRRPALVARCTGTADVVAAIRYARDRDLVVSVKGGGHGVGGFAVGDDALMIDLSLMKGVRVDPDARLVSAQPGVVLGELDRATQVHGLAVPVGINTTTGIAGLTLGGGIGWLMRRHGLTIDNLVSVELVTADGEVVRAAEDENADLFWGVRGAGANFGIVTDFTYRAHPVGPDVLAGALVWPMEDAPRLLRAYRDLCEALPDEVTTIVGLRLAPPAPWIPDHVHGTPVLQIAACHAGSVDDGDQALRPLRALGQPLVDAITPRPFVQFQSLLDATVPKGWHYYWKSHDLPPLTDDVIDTVVEHSLRLTSPRSYSLLPHLGGAVARVAEDATAYSHRDAAHAININAVWLPDDPEPDRHIAWVRRLFAALEPYATGVYVNFLGAEGPARVEAAYGRDKYQRLVGLKTRWDPSNFLHLNQNIPPSAGSPPRSPRPASAAPSPR
jgi:FAD/FMN-containing dehydrogenase